MKINLIGMILSNAGRRCFDGAILGDNGNPMPAADSLHHMIMEYAKVMNGGTSNVVTVSREVLTATPPAALEHPSADAGDAEIAAAARNLVAQKGRYNTEQAYKRLEAVIAAQKAANGVRG